MVGHAKSGTICKGGVGVLFGSEGGILGVASCCATNGGTHACIDFFRDAVTLPAVVDKKVKSEKVDGVT